MKVKAIDDKLVQFPGLAGVYVAASLERVDEKDESGRVIGMTLKAKFTGETIELRAEGQSLQDWKIARIRDNTLAYWMRKVKDGDLAAADEEMAKLCGVSWTPEPLEQPAPVSKKSPSPAPADKPAPAATKG